MKTSEGQCRGWEVREGMCQLFAGKNCHAPAGRQNPRTALGIKKKKKKAQTKKPQPQFDIGLYFWRSNFAGFSWGRPLCFRSTDDLARVSVEVETEGTVQHTSESATF